MAELACIAVHSDYRGKDHIKHIRTKLLSASEEIARKNGSETLFVLTTQAREWFLAKVLRFFFGALPRKDYTIGKDSLKYFQSH